MDAELQKCARSIFENEFETDIAKLDETKNLTEEYETKLDESTSLILKYSVDATTDYDDTINYNQNDKIKIIINIPKIDIAKVIWIK